MYNRTLEVCCGSKLYPAQWKEYSACCGIPKYVNYTTNVPTQYIVVGQVCCNGVITNLTNLFDADVPTIIANLGADIASKVGCCKDAAYSTVDQKCCGNTVHNITGNPKAQCCRSDVINPDTQICCNGYVYNDTSLKCCGANAYDPTTAKVTELTCLGLGKAASF